jgi:RHS repeat-associated protein
VNQTVSYLASDLLGSAEVALTTSGTATASVLYGPYGTARYTNGAMPTDYVFTGQHGDATTGLDYYGARYYDPTIGQFASADSDAKGGLNRYAYVGGNPETRTDPTGHLFTCGNSCGGGNGTPPPPPPPSPPPPPYCHANTCHSHEPPPPAPRNQHPPATKKPKCLDRGACDYLADQGITGKQTTPTAAQISQAQKDAGGIAETLFWLGGGLGVLSLLLGTLSALLTTAAGEQIFSIIGIVGGVKAAELAGQVAVAAGIIGALGAEAGIVGAMFQGQTSQTTGWDLNSLEIFRNKVYVFVGAMTGVFAFLANLGSFINEVDSIDPSGGLGAIALQVTSDAAKLASIGIGVWANQVISQEENDVGD